MAESIVFVWFLALVEASAGGLLHVAAGSMWQPARTGRAPRRLLSFWFSALDEASAGGLLHVAVGSRWQLARTGRAPRRLFFFGSPHWLRPVRVGCYTLPLAACGSLPADASGNTLKTRQCTCIGRAGIPWKTA